MIRQESLSSRSALLDLGTGKLIGRASFLIGVLSITGLVLAFFTVPAPVESYLQNIRALSITHADLPWVMLVTGLILLAVTSFHTWLVTLYFSFRIAGPLFRFTRNLQHWMDNKQHPWVPVRKGDALQAEAKLLQETLTGYASHLDNMHHLLKQAEQAAREQDFRQLELCLVALKQAAGKAATRRHDPAQ